MARVVLLMLGLALGAIVGLASGGGAVANQWVGALGLVVLLLWSGLALLLGRGVAPIRPVAPDRAGEARVAPWLAVALVGIGMTLLWGDRTAFGVPLLWATVLPAAVAYAGLLFDIGRARPAPFTVRPSRPSSSTPSEAVGLGSVACRTVPKTEGVGGGRRRRRDRRMSPRRRR